MSFNTARNFMRVADVYGGKSANIAHLDVSALYELAAPKTPQEVRDEVERLIEAGEVVKKADIIKLKAEFEAVDREML